MITRRQFIFGLPLVYFFSTVRVVRAQGVIEMCARYTNGTMSYCDDHRTYSGQGSAPSGPSLSPSPWRTWNSEQLRQWDADVARWGSVSRNTFNAVEELAAGLPDVDPKTGERYANLKTAISVALRNIADDVINNTLPDSRETERFWGELRSAADGWQRYKAVSKAEVLGQYSKKTPDLSAYLHPNGLIKSAAANDPFAEVKFAGRTPDAFERSTVNALEFTREVLADALEVAGPKYAERAQQASDALIVYELLLLSSFTHPVDHSALVMVFGQNVVNDLAAFFEGLASGAHRTAGEIIDSIVNIVTSPVQTVSAIAKAIWPLDDFLIATFKAVVADIRTFITGTPFERGEIVGNFVVTLLTAELGAKAASRLGGTALGARIGAAYTSLGDVAAASWLAQRAVGAVEYVGQLKNAFQAELRAALRFADTPETLAISLEIKLLEAEVLEGFRLYPDEAKLPQKLKDILYERRDVLSETDKLIAEAAHIAVNGRFSSLDEVRATLDRIVLTTGLDRQAFGYANERLSRSFEQVIARRVNGKWNFFDPPEGSRRPRQFDVKSSTELIQCSMKEFKTASDVPDWLNRERIANQIDETVKTAGRLGLEPTYWFRWQPPNDVVEALKAKGIKNVRWDLPPR